jgi:hypothetical protein
MTGQVLRRAAIGGALLSALAIVCPAQIFPDAPEAAAKVISLTGQVSVLRDAEPWALKVGDLVQVKQVILTGPDGFAQFQVSDGSTFEVYPNSNVIFRRNPPNWKDLLDVFVGRVKIHIQKWGGQPNPNRIHTPTAVISVRGTTFDVSVNEDDETTVVSVEEGQVDVRHALKGDSRIVNAGESIRVYKDQPLAHSLIDKPALARRVLRSLADAVYTAGGNLSRSRTGTGTGGPTYPGQTPPPPPPAGPPPPPSAPPPPIH